MGPMDRARIEAAYKALDAGVGVKIRDLYRTSDSTGADAQVLYHFWVMQTACPHCAETVDLFSSYVFAANAYPARKPEVQVVCPSCGDIFEGRHGRTSETCPHCANSFNPQVGTAKGQNATCPHCCLLYTSDAADDL